MRVDTFRTTMGPAELRAGPFCIRLRSLVPFWEAYNHEEHACAAFEHGNAGCAQSRWLQLSVAMRSVKGITSFLEVDLQ